MVITNLPMKLFGLWSMSGNLYV